MNQVKVEPIGYAEIGDNDTYYFAEELAYDLCTALNIESVIEYCQERQDEDGELHPGAQQLLELCWLAKADGAREIIFYPKEGE